MIGIIFIVATIAYLAIVIGATRLIYSYAKKRGYKAWKRVLFAVLGFLLVTLPIFWDAIPTHIAYKRYCEKEAGFTTFKTLEQWQAENPGVTETLHFLKDASNVKIGEHRYRRAINERFASEDFYGFVFLGVRKSERKLIDIRNNEVLYSYRYFHAAYVTPSMTPYEGVSGFDTIKIWINEPVCGGEYSKKFEALLTQVSEMGSK